MGKLFSKKKKEDNNGPTLKVNPPAPKKDEELCVKCIMLGDAGTGKSSLILRFAENEFLDQFISTIGVDSKEKTVTIESGSKVKLDVWDTAGQERFRTLTSGYFRGIQAAMVVFDLTKKESYQHASSWIKEVENYTDGTVVVLCGNKSDLEKDRVISYDEANQLARDFGIPYFETSCKTGEGVEAAFVALAQNTYNQNVY